MPSYQRQSRSCAVWQLLYGCLLVMVSPLQSVTAADDLEVHVYFGASVVDFGYQEFTDNGVLLDREDGLLPGMLLGFSLAKYPWRVTLERDYYSDTVDYTGQTLRGGIPLKTQSEASITDDVIWVGYDVIQENGLQHVLYGGLGWHRWERNILPTRLPDGRAVAGLLEIYQWGYFLMGAKIGTYQRGSRSLQLDVRVTHTVLPEIEVDFMGFAGYDNLEFELGRQNGARIGLVFTQELADRWELLVEPYYETWGFGRSDNQTLTSGGVPVNMSIFEPGSETSNYGLNIVLKLSAF